MKDMNQKLSIDFGLFVGLVVLLTASTMNGLTSEVRAGALSMTIRPDQVVLVLLLPLLAVAFVQRRLRWHRTSLDVPVLGLFLANAFASVVFSPLKGMSLQGVLLMGVYVAMYFVTVNLSLQYPRWSTRLMRIFVGIGIVHAAYGLLALLAYSQGRSIGGITVGQVMPGSVSVRGAFVEPNLLGIYLSIIGLFPSVYLLFGNKAKNRCLAFASLILVGLTLILTLTRSAWVAFVTAVSFLVPLLLMKVKSLSSAAARLAPLVLAAVLVLAVSIYALDPLLSRLWKQESVLTSRLGSLLMLSEGRSTVDTGVHVVRTGGQAGEQPSQTAPSVEEVGQQGAQAAPTAPQAIPTAEQAVPTPTPSVQQNAPVVVGSLRSAMGRLQVYEWGIAESLNRPIFGHGTFAGEVIGNRYWMSSLIQALYDTGIVGALFLLWMHGAAIISAWLAYRRATAPFYRNSLLALALGNAVLLLTSQFSSFLWVGFPWVFMGLTMGLVQARDRQSSPE